MNSNPDPIHDNHSVARKGVSPMIYLVGGACAFAAVAYWLGVLPHLAQERELKAEAQQAVQQALRVEVVTGHLEGGSDLVLPGNIQAITDTPIFARASGLYLQAIRRYRQSGACRPTAGGDRRSGSASESHSGTGGHGQGALHCGPVAIRCRETAGGRPCRPRRIRPAPPPRQARRARWSPMRRRDWRRRKRAKAQAQAQLVQAQEYPRQPEGGPCAVRSAIGLRGYDRKALPGPLRTRASSHARTTIRRRRASRSRALRPIPQNLRCAQRRPTYSRRRRP